MKARRNTIPVNVGSVTIGGDAPISVQTMSTINPVHTVEAIADVNRLASYGAELIRFAVPDMAAAKALRHVVSASSVPLIADIHFDYQLALAAVDSGVQGLRINPGNIGSDDNVYAVVDKVRPREFLSVLALILDRCLKISSNNTMVIRQQKEW